MQTIIGFAEPGWIYLGFWHTDQTGGNGLKEDLVKRILQLKAERNALIIAHNYQIDEVQDIADYVGDSFGLSRLAADTDKEVIVFCGVHFMAEVAAILAPQKTVLLPEPAAGCPMADMVTVDGLKKMKAEHPAAAVVCYVNSSAEIKAESDISCTSANAVQVVNSLPNEEIIFVPDRNLAHWVSLHTAKKIIPWPGFCPTHQKVTVQDVDMIRQERPGIPVAVHPECDPAVVAKADYVGSTGGILDFAKKSPANEMIIGTEMGILHRLEKENPGKRFFLLSPRLICPNMKYTNLEKVLNSLEKMEKVITVREDIRQQAKETLLKMLAVG